jgi:hypothetical protein
MIAASFGMARSEFVWFGMPPFGSELPDVSGALKVCYRTPSRPTG